MKIIAIDHFPYTMPLTTGLVRAGIHLRITSNTGRIGWGEVAPLPKWSHETLNDCLNELDTKETQIKSISWSLPIWEQLKGLHLLPALSFGLESAILSILNPLPKFSINTSCLLMGTSHEMLQQAQTAIAAGFHKAKIKVGHLSCTEAHELIQILRNQLRLRIDVNRGWNNSDSLRFFQPFPIDAFDYVEEPFSNPHDLNKFPLPFAIDESFPIDLSLKDMEKMPTLKAIVYKPTIQGGITNCLELYDWTKKMDRQLVLSSSFESDLGLTQIACMAKRLELGTDIGIGTFNYHNRLGDLIRFDGSQAILATYQGESLLPALSTYVHNAHA